MTSFLQKSQQIFQLSGGCPALVEFLNMIRWIDQHGDTAYLLDRVEIRPARKVKEVEDIKKKLVMHFQDVFKKQFSTVSEAST